MSDSITLTGQTNGTVTLTGGSGGALIFQGASQGQKGDKGDKGDQGDPATNLVTSVAGKQGVVTLDKTDVGLSNVENTSDAAKPISTATQAALDNKADLVNGKVPESQLPSFVDDVVSLNSLSDFPLNGEDGKIYIAKDTNLTYRWAGSVYTEISPSLALGETASTAYRGDWGKIAYDHTLNTNNPHSVTKAQVGLSDVDNTSDANKPVSTAQQTALNAKANASDTVNLTGDQTVAGVKTFSSSPIAPSGTSIGGVLHLTGTGFPNGVVSAPVGSIYIDTAVTNGASSWIKKSGAGNTGWQVLEGDTGWRVITSWNSAGVVTGTMPVNMSPRVGRAGDIRLRRRNSTVEVYLREATFAAGSVVITSYIGFRSGSPYFPTVPIAINTLTSLRVGNAYYFITATAGSMQDDFGASAFFETTSDWPTTLPGTAA